MTIVSAALSATSGACHCNALPRRLKPAGRCHTLSNFKVIAIETLLTGVWKKPAGLNQLPIPANSNDCCESSLQLPGPCRCSASPEIYKKKRLGSSNCQFLQVLMIVSHFSAMPHSYHFPAYCRRNACPPSFEPARPIQLPIPSNSNDSCLQIARKCHALSKVQVLAIAMLLLRFQNMPAVPRSKPLQWFSFD